MKLNNKINWTQIAKKLAKKDARAMYHIDNGNVYISDGVFVGKITKGEFDNLVNGYELNLATFQKNEAIKKIYDGLVDEFKNETEQRSFLHFYYKDSTKTLSYANLNGKVIAVNKTYIELVGPEKRNGEVVFNATKVKSPVRLLDNLFVCPVNVGEGAFDELAFIFGATKKEEAPVNDAKQEEPKTKTEQAVNDALFEVKDGTRAGFYEFYFKEKPSAEVLQLIKGFNMHWNRNKMCWFGYVNKDEVAEAITKAVA